MESKDMIAGNRVKRLQILVSYTQKLAWVLFLLFLPVTSFPSFPTVLGGRALVRPLSLYPLLLLLILVTIPRLFRRPVPRTLRNLLPFVLIAIASSLLSTLRGIDPVLGISVNDRIIRGLITLGIGCAIYYTVSIYPRAPDDLRSALRWLYAGFGLALFWGSMQAIYVVNFVRPYFQFLQGIQEFISTRRLFTTRVSGMTYEPNWFAEQICFLLIPWLLASVLSGYSVFRWRWRWVTIELFFLIWAILVLVFTFSRTGLFVLVALLFVGILFFRSPGRKEGEKGSSRTKTWVRRLAEAGLLVVVLVGMIYFVGSQNMFFSRLWNYWSEASKTTVAGFFEYIGFSARFAYGQAAYSTFEAYPEIGVGVGNYAFYFQEMLPDEPIARTPELLKIVTPDPGRNRLITPKNFYFRILSETGLIGAAAFVAFLIAVLGCALFLWYSAEKEQYFWGKAGLLGLIAFALTAFSFDSFAIPNMWVVFGLITSAAWVFGRKEIDDGTTSVDIKSEGVS
jgi:O-antigen ligase